MPDSGDSPVAKASESAPLSVQLRPRHPAAMTELTVTGPLRPAHWPAQTILVAPKRAAESPHRGRRARPVAIDNRHEPRELRIRSLAHARPAIRRAHP